MIPHSDSASPSQPPRHQPATQGLRRLWQRLQQPGDHWFLLLYIGGLGVLLLVVSLLKLGMRWL